MSVMNGFRTDLTNKIIGLNPHLTIQFNSKQDLKKIKKIINKKYSDIKFTESITGEGIILIEDKIKGVLIKGIKENEKSYIVF